MSTCRSGTRPLSARVALLVALAAALTLDVRSAVAQPSEAGIDESAPPALVQIGFGASLNWGFVASDARVAQQIYELLPRGVADALGVAESEVAIAQLQAFDTSQALGYVTTLALICVPSTSVSVLQQQVLDPGSPLYSSAEPRVAQLMSYINPGIYLVP